MLKLNWNLNTRSVKERLRFSRDSGLSCHFAFLNHFSLGRLVPQNTEVFEVRHIFKQEHATVFNHLALLKSHFLGEGLVLPYSFRLLDYEGAEL